MKAIFILAVELICIGVGFVQRKPIQFSENKF